MKTTIKETIYQLADKVFSGILSKGLTFRSLTSVMLLLTSIFFVTSSLTMDTYTVKKPVVEVAYAKGLPEEEQDIEIPKLESDLEEGIEGSILTFESKEEAGSEGKEEPKDVLTEEEEFVELISPIAVEVAREFKVYPSIIVAQAILESDWGRSELAVNGNNLFGIKGSYEGQSYSKKTMEDDGTGFQYEITANFAKYPTIKESIRGNASLIRNGVSFDGNIYSGAWRENATDYKQATASLVGVYATDINYNQKVNDIIEKYELNALDNL